MTKASTFYRRNDPGSRVSDTPRKSRTCSRHRLRIYSSLLFVSPENKKAWDQAPQWGKNLVKKEKYRSVKRAERWPGEGDGRPPPFPSFPADVLEVRHAFLPRGTSACVDLCIQTVFSRLTFPLLAMSTPIFFLVFPPRCGAWSQPKIKTI